jgi:hypothetical protein
MRKIWKWILLFIGVVVVGFLAALPFFGMRRFGFARFGRPMMSRNFRGMPFGMMHGGIVLTVLSCLVGVAVIAAIVIAIVLLVRRKKQPASAVVPPVSPTPVAAETIEAAPAATTPVCAHCGQPLQANWVACPHCGAKVEVPENPTNPEVPKPE